MDDKLTQYEIMVLCSVALLLRWVIDDTTYKPAIELRYALEALEKIIERHG